MSTVLSVHDVLEQIAPERGAKYSPNLYRWLRKHAVWLEGDVRVYRDTLGDLWIGRIDDGFFNGCRMMRVLCLGARASRAMWTAIGELRLVADFWRDYAASGRCAIDRDHALSFIGGESRWSVQGDLRECLWCGNARQVLRRWTDSVERRVWENAD